MVQCRPLRVLALITAATSFGPNQDTYASSLFNWSSFVAHLFPLKDQCMEHDDADERRGLLNQTAKSRYVCVSQMVRVFLDFSLHLAIPFIHSGHLRAILNCTDLHQQHHTNPYAELQPAFDVFPRGPPTTGHANSIKHIPSYPQSKPNHGNSFPRCILHLSPSPAIYTLQSCQDRVGRTAAFWRYLLNLNQRSLIYSLSGC